ncbi:ABC transporter ATP-binding protein [Crossiella cryophila]|uniref:ABC-2 type transport system ATP-binding protein n=1 Tax=Crossiella cryophila TaxID=43355 RepID=A0A7W7CA31_9PSEU|nr:ABC transporter ATP-binding protein [Crossiella cryophila]MBB4676111.1 ABC-2 type transport system ATP-binding protein [Crossiella cryophila]
MSAATDALEVTGIGKQYRRLFGRGSNWALRDCTFRVPAGRVAALVGPNGAGKTTLLTMLAGLLTPTEGSAQIGGRPVAAGRSRGGEGRVSFVAQDKPLYRQLQVATMLEVAARFNHVWDPSRAARWLERFEIPLDRPCGRLSGGQQAQVAFAIALGSCPSVLLLDEPLSNLDPLARREVTQELLTEAADTGMTVLLSTHVVAELGGVTDHLVLLADGALLVDDAVDDILGSHRYYVGPRSTAPPVPGEVVRASHTDHQSTFLLRVPPPLEPPAVAAPWTSREMTLEDFVLTQLETKRANSRRAA